MFAPRSTPFAASSTAYKRSDLYHQVGLETSLSDASPHRLIAMLYDGALEAIAQARGAISQGNIELKCKAISRAACIVEEGLRSSVNRAQGGSLATQLHELYGYIVRRLTEANLHNDDTALAECARLIEPLREAWRGIAAQTHLPPKA